VINLIHSTVVLFAHLNFGCCICLFIQRPKFGLTNVLKFFLKDCIEASVSRIQNQEPINKLVEDQFQKIK
jgi:hypothetical protein